MTIQHKLITDPDIHEPKGVAASTANKVYVADGAGSGTWKKLSPPQLSGLTTNGTAGDTITVDGSGNFVFAGAPHGAVNFYNLASPYTLTYPSTFTKLAPTTTAGGVPAQFTEATTARLTYTGSDTVPVSVTYSVSLDQTSGTNRDIVVAVAKNGTVVNGYSVLTVQSSQIHNTAGTATINLATNDYVEIFAINTGATGNIRVYSLEMNAIFAGA
jgi:aspartate 1-decarboxylase